MKQPIGILPKLLKSLLDGRKDIKREMKQYTHEEMMHVVLDKRQLAYKVSANSAYGAMGVTKGYLPFMPGAMCTTAMGRQNIQKAANIVQTKYAGKIIYGDSVSGSTVLLLRNARNEMHIQSIEDFYKQYDRIDYPELQKNGLDKYRAEVTDEISILSMSGWTRIHRVISHKTRKRMFRIYSSSCFIEVTEDHSLILENGEWISPRDVIPGYHVLCTVKGKEWERIQLLQGKILMMSNKIHMRRDGMFVMKMHNYGHCMSVYLFLRSEYPHMIVIFERDEILFDVENKRNIKRGEIYRVEFVTPKEFETVYDIETEDGTFHAGIGDVIVKNTDSIYYHFTELRHSKEIWKTAKEIEYELGNKVFPPPMKLLFEEKIYQRFLILTKKRYMAMTCDEEGKDDEKLTSRGVLLARRDNCYWIRSVYERTVRQIMQRMTLDEIIDDLHSQILELFTFQIENRPECFVISKLLGKDYKIRSLPDDPKKRRQRLLELDIDESTEDWEKEYEEKSKPAHVQLASRMKHRGFPVSCGTRIEYIILEDFLKKNSKLYDKIEDPVYYWKHRDILRIDCFYYFKSLIKPIDQLLGIVFPCKRPKGPLALLYTVHSQHKLVMKEIRRPPNFHFIS
jgi:hypothetical protein